MIIICPICKMDSNPTLYACRTITLFKTGLPEEDPYNGKEYSVHLICMDKIIKWYFTHRKSK